jgi:hypothetical protein
MNRNTNKCSLIQEKILWSHKLDQVNFAPTSLPAVFSWLGDTDVDRTLGLSQLFGMLHIMPHMIKHRVDGTRGVKHKDLNDH